MQHTRLCPDSVDFSEKTLANQPLQKKSAKQNHRNQTQFNCYQKSDAAIIPNTLTKDHFPCLLPLLDLL